VLGESWHGLIYPTQPVHRLLGPMSSFPCGMSIEKKRERRKPLTTREADIVSDNG